MFSEAKNRIRICLTASSGGHLNQLLKLADSWKDYETFSITTVESATSSLEEFGYVYVVGECNRYQLWRLLKTLLRCIKPILIKRPDVVVSTGAAVGYFACALGKLIGARVVWIDSITNVERMSLSGRLVRRFADVVIVQWPELKKRYRNVEYLGSVI